MRHEKREHDIKHRHHHEYSREGRHDRREENQTEGHGSIDERRGRRHGGREKGRTGRHGGQGRFSIPGLLEGKPDAMILFVGALGCTRHRGFQMGDLMREGKMALLCPTATDFATGRYLHQIVDAMAELKDERGVTEFVLMYGCQTALLSTDFDLILQEAKENHGITVSVREVCHLCQTEAAKKEQENERSEAQ